MELSNSLLLNEEALRQCADPMKPLFIYEWLRYLDRILPATQKSDIKSCQQKLVEQLTSRIATGPGPPTRRLLARCLAQVFTIADAYDLFQTINTCNDTFKAKDDSTVQLPVKLTALTVLGSMYESLGRMVGRSYEESFQLLIKWLKSAESSSRAEILLTLSKMIHGLGSAAFSIHKDLFKLLSKTYLTDRILSVRAAAATCLHDLVSQPGSPVLANDLDAISTLCLKSLEGANYEVRMIVAKIFARLATAESQSSDSGIGGSSLVGSSSSGASPATVKMNTVEDVFSCLAAGFLRGGIAGFLKSSTTNTAVAGGSQEVRVGVAYAYVEVIRQLKPSWLEKNLSMVLRHLLDLTSRAGPLAFTKNPVQVAEVVHMRRCVNYILRKTVGDLLSESIQISACKLLGEMITEYVAGYDIAVDGGAADGDPASGGVGDSPVVDAGAHASALASTVALMEIGALVCQVGTAVTPLFVEASGIMEPVFACLQHPVSSTRLAAAWCLRCVTFAVTSQRTPLVDRCINRLSRLEHLKKSPEAIAGYAYALAALLAGASDCQMGIPFAKSKQVFAIAEDMIKTASQTCKLALQKVKAGWLLITAVIAMGTPFIRHNVSRLLLLWKYAFPRSIDEAKAEKGRGDIFTWQCTLEARAGALASMEAFLLQCPDLSDDNLLKKIVQPLETSLTTMAFVGDLLFTHGIQLRHPIYTFRVRLYSLLSHINISYIEHMLSPLLREVVADITLSDNSTAATTSSLTSKLCASFEGVFLDGWVRNTAQADLEEKLHLGHLSSELTIENDVLSLVNASLDDELTIAPVPVHVAAIDAAIATFGRIYPLAPTKHKIQLTNHFVASLKNVKNVNRLHAIQANVLTAMLCAWKPPTNGRKAVIEDDLQQASVALILPYVNADKVLIKCVAIEALGHLAHAVGEPQFVAGNAQLCFDRLRTIRDEKSRTGFCLALGCLHRHVGSLGSGQHLNTSVSIILALAQDNSSPVVQAWAILSLSLIATTGGGMFRGYVEPSLSLCLRLLLNTPSTNTEIILCVGKLVNALITSVGPELQTATGGMDSMRSSFLTASSMLFEHSNSQVKAEAIASWQQLHLFTPRHVELDRLVTNICHLLKNEHLILRKAAVSCLRQLLQREVKEVREHAQTLIPIGIMEHSKALRCPLPETGLEGALFEMLDVETDFELRQHIKEALNFLVQATSGELLSHWLTMCKDILASTSLSTSENMVKSTLVIGATEKPDDDAADDEDTLASGAAIADQRARDKIQPRWPTRVFAFDIVRRLMGVCDTERAQTDFALATELIQVGGSTSQPVDYLVLHISDLVKMSFMGATSDNSDLRLAGLACLQDVITRFATVPDPGFPGDVILKQFQAQVGAALRPAFEAETPSHVTAAACQVCSTWIGSGVARDLNDLRRVNHLLVSSLNKLKHGSINTQLYNESVATLEKLAILKAWAEVYIVAIAEQKNAIKATTAEPQQQQLPPDESASPPSENLLNLVNPELNTLVGHWLAVLRDSALLSLPSEFASQLPESGGAFYTPESADSCKEYYRTSWPPILLATSIWLNVNNFEYTPPQASDGTPSPTAQQAPWLFDTRESRFALLLGMACEALCCSSRSYTDSDRTVQLCLSTLKNLIECHWAQLELMRDVRVAVEMMNVLHRLVLTRDNLQTQHLCADVVLAVMTAARTAMKTVGVEDVINGNINPETAVYNGYPGGEGINGFELHSSLSFATLEIALCLLVRQIPQINSALMKSKSSAPLHFRKYTRLPSEGCELVKLGIRLLTQVPTLCSPEGSIVVLPTVLYLILGVLRESSRVDVDPATGVEMSTGHVSGAAAAAMIALREIILVSPAPDSEIFDSWSSVVRSSLLSLLNMVEGECRVDRAVVMLAATVVTTSLPTTIPIGAPLFHKLCRLLKNCLLHDVVAISLKAIQSVNSIFVKREICAPYIRELGPVIFDILRPYVLPESKATSPTVETDLPVLESIGESEAIVVQEAVKVVESALKAASAEKKPLFVNLLLRCLARFLVNDPATELAGLPVHIRRLHDFAFARVNAIGPLYPDAFRSVVQACPAIRVRIERAALLVSRTQTASQQAAAAAAAAQQQRLAAASAASSHQPTIKLTMNFAAFTGGDEEKATKPDDEVQVRQE